MKSKLIFLGIALALLLAAFVFQTADHADLYARDLQHTHSLPGGEAPEGSTHLPIIALETGGQKIPGEPITEPGMGTVGYETGDNGETQILSGLKIYSQDGEWNSVLDEAAYDGMALIRYRGNSSRHFDKKSYLVHLSDETGKYINRSILGLPSANEWTLNGPFLDRTLIRNYLCYNIAGQVMTYVPRVMFCQLYLDGEYQGLYLLTETITRDPGRVEMTKPKNDSVFTSWIVRMDRTDKADPLLDTFSYYTLNAGASAFELRYPGKETATPERVRYVETDVSSIERLLYSSDIGDPNEGYATVLDTTAFAQYFVLNEFFGNKDAGRFSTFLYRDIRGKVTPVVWDFNNGCDNYISSVHPGEGFDLINTPWISQLMTQQEFVDEVIMQYRVMRKTVLSDKYLQKFIDETIAYLGDEVDRNNDLWGYVFDFDETADQVNYLYPAERNYASYDDAVAQLKGWITYRGQWLDKNIENLYQYCQASKTGSIGAN